MRRRISGEVAANLPGLRGLACFGWDIYRDEVWLWRSKPGYRKACRILRRSRFRATLVLAQPVYVARLRLDP